MVVSQQVSTASAAAIFARLQAALPGLAVADLLAAPDPVLRGAGLSADKVLTLRAAAIAVLDGRLPLDRLADLPADEAAARLTALRGIGPWTAQLYLLSCLGHADAWPPGDIALEEAAKLALGLAARPDRAALARIAERWRPHRAVAARLLWAITAPARPGTAGASGSAMVRIASLKVISARRSAMRDCFVRLSKVTLPCSLHPCEACWS